MWPGSHVDAAAVIALECWTECGKSSINRRYGGLLAELALPSHFQLVNFAQVVLRCQQR